MLWGIERELLPRLIFPVGGREKTEIRRIAAELGLGVAQKPDSQEICFVPDQDHARFIRQHCGNVDTGGEIVTTDGVVVGRHQGLEQFTIGQRKDFASPSASRGTWCESRRSRAGWSWARRTSWPGES